MSIKQRVSCLMPNGTFLLFIEVRLRICIHALILTIIFMCRIEALRHCRWVDQVVPDAPWVITPDFLEKYQIDYVAHDEDPYKSEGLGIDDTYGDVKRAGESTSSPFQ